MAARDKSFVLTTITVALRRSRSAVLPGRRGPRIRSQRRRRNQMGRCRRSNLRCRGARAARRRLPHSGDGSRWSGRRRRNRSPTSISASAPTTARRSAAPVRVNDVEGEARASGEQPARVVMNKTIHVVWPARIDGRPVIRYARSEDDGRSFSKAETVAGEGRSGARGWEAMTLGYDGGVQLVWLDGRNDKSTAKHQHRGPAPAKKTPMKSGGGGAAARHLSCVLEG